LDYKKAVARKKEGRKKTGEGWSKTKKTENLADHVYPQKTIEWDPGKATAITGKRRGIGRR